MNVVFLAAGLSSRFGRPKQLEPVGGAGQSLLDYGVFDAVRAGADRLIMVTRNELRAALEEHLMATFGPLPVSFALQPSPGGRPGGTGHAVLAAADLIDGPFVVANADDFYGAAAWSAIVGFMSNPSDNSANAMVAYPLGETLSASGGVSRAICHLADGNMLESIEEWKDLRRAGEGVAGLDLAGRPGTLPPDVWVSLNLWGFVPAVIPALRRQFERHTQGEAPGAGEFLLSEALRDMLEAGETTVRVLTSRDQWFGLTHPDDCATVRTRISALTTAGTYPVRFANNP